MPASQPLDVAPDLSDTSIRGAWLNAIVRGGNLGVDASPAADDMTPINPTDIVARSVGAEFGGTNGYLRRAENDWQSGDHIGTILAWVKRDAINDDIIFGSADEAGATSYLWFYGTSNYLAIRVRIGGANNAIRTPIGSLLADQWYRVAVTCDGAAWALYINGVAQDLVVISGSNAGTWLADIASRNNITIGVSRRNGVFGFFGGQIKDVQYLSRVLTPAQLVYDYKLSVPDDSLAFWTIGGMTDLTRYQLPITLWNDVVAGHEMSFAGGVSGQSLETTAVELLTGAAVSFWFNARADEEAVLFNNVAHLNRRLVVKTYAGGALRAGYWQGAVYRAASGTGYQINRWHHIYCSTDTDQTCRLWLDGTELTGAVDPSSGNGINLRLGASSSGSGNFNGRMRDVRLWQEDKGEAFGEMLYQTERKYD